MINQKQNNLLKRLIQISLSLFVSFLFIWVTGYLFCNSLDHYQYDEKLTKVIPAPGTIKYRSEGIATTYRGAYGINAIEDITRDSRKKIVVWGDSYIEALQVDDCLKIPQVVNKNLLNIGLGHKLMCFGVGKGGNSVADYYFDIPKYENLVQGIKTHFIIIPNIYDTLPDQPTDNERGIFKSKPFRLYYDNGNPKYQKVKKILNEYRLYFIWEPIRKAFSSAKKLKFKPYNKKNNINIKKPKNNIYSKKFMIDSWSFLFNKLREQTLHPIIFIYCPPVPKIQKGTISMTDNNADQIKLFSRIAEKYDIKVMNSTNYFIDFYKNTGLFPRGFPNSKPSEGHFNKYGHEIVAKMITDYISDTGKL